MDYQTILRQQQDFFRTGETRSIAFRKAQLAKLKTLILKNEAPLYEAIAADFGKSAFETYSTELSFILKEIDYFTRHLGTLSRPRRVRTNLLHLPGSSRIYLERMGNALVIGAWNYPYQLSLLPAVAAIAAGNTVILKPSEIAAASAACMQQIINNHFDAGFFHTITAGPEETEKLLQLKFDKIFYTGSTRVGKLVYEAAAKNLTPVTLELGGKSPAVVTATADVEVAAKGIVWGKFLNAGQTCIAPDYVYADEKIVAALLAAMKRNISEAGYSSGAEQYTRIINQKNHERLVKLIRRDQVFTGGEHDAKTLYIAPTLLKDISWDEPVMQEEIFGPLLPVLTYRSFEAMTQEISRHPRPLAAYLFTADRKEKSRFLQEVSFGGGCINDVIMHMLNARLPFGGIGHSGIGNYHGKAGFDSFSHYKSVLARKTWGEPQLKYPPYTAKSKQWMKRMM